MSLRLADLDVLPAQPSGKVAPEFLAPPDVFEAPTETPRTTEAAERRELAELLSSMLGPA